MSTDQDTAADVEASASTDSPPESDSVPSGAEFGRLYRAHVEREIDPSTAVAAEGVNDEDELPDEVDPTAAAESTEGAEPAASKPAAAEAKPLTRRGAAAEIERLNQTLAETQADIDKRIADGIAAAEKAKADAESALKVRTDAEAEVAQIHATEFGEEQVYQKLLSRKAAEDPTLTAEEHDNLARWEVNRTRLYPVAAQQVTQQWRELVSSRVYALVEAKIPGVDPDKIIAAGNQSVDHLFLAWHAAGAAAQESKVAAATERAEAAEQRVQQLETDLRTLRPQAAGRVSTGLPSGTSATAAAPNRVITNRQTASAHDLMMSGLRNSASGPQSRRSSR